MNKTILLLIAMTFFAPACNAQSAAQPDRLVRVTTGYHQVSGWEKPLVDGNPNLAHYHWTPQGGYDQGYLHIRSPQRPQGSVYTKPIHISPDAYVPKTKESQPLANHVSSPDTARRDNLLAGQLLPEQRVQAMVAQPPRVATYADYETRGRLVPRAKHHQQDGFANESVSGQLLSRGYRRAM
ncbi:MAG: hypothetical protein U0103_00370 [Candidatus Obscuribacterales bacterium]|nr:MAG: hypothetical protein EKK48_11795 [Candidatus Melainabacteria bacterium]